ncbi:MAG TPA: IS66 family insertion sequence element accessory protein TnpB, partial [Acetobacteraceae bacterium]|nr:IS66 family insertion sequence element accessory protein TnpB [Acetobacteraceae bacterium]
ALWWDGQGLVLLAKRLEKGRFVWPTIAREGAVTLTTAQLAMLLAYLRSNKLSNRVFQDLRRPEYQRTGTGPPSAAVCPAPIRRLRAALSSAARIGFPRRTWFSVVPAGTWP